AILVFFFFFQAEDGIRVRNVTGVQTCALPICPAPDALPATPPPDLSAWERLRRAVMFWRSWADPVACTLLTPSGLLPGEMTTVRSEERRVGKECRYRGAMV